MRSEKLAAIGHMSGGVAHDLRNPLGAIRNAAYLLNKRLSSDMAVQANPRIRKPLEIIERQVDRASIIITDRVTLARLQAPSLAPTDLGEIVEKCLSNWEGKRMWRS